MQRGQEPGAGTGTCRERGQGRAGSGNGNVPEKERRGGDRSGDRPAGAEGRGTSAGAGTGAEAIKGAERGQRGRKAAGERAPEVTENDVVLPRKGSIPVRQCPRAACSPATPLRQLPPLLRRDATPSAHRPAALHHPSLHTSANFPSLAPPRGLFPPLSARSCSSGRAEEAPRRAGHRLPSPQIHTTNPSPPEHAQKKSGIRCRMPPHGTDAPPTRGRRPYRPLRAGRRTRPAYWPQSTPR